MQRRHLEAAYKPILPSQQEDTGEYLKAWDVTIKFQPHI